MGITDALAGATRTLEIVRLRPELPDPVVEVLANYETSAAAIRAEPFIEKEKSRRVLELQKTTRAALAPLLEDAERTTARQFDQAEGEARAEAKDVLRIPAYGGERDAKLLEEVHAQRRTAATQIDVALIVQAQDPTTVEDLFTDALLSENSFAITRIGTAAIARLTTLEAAERRRANPPPGQYVKTDAGAALTRVREAMQEWRREHPSARDRIRAAQSQREAAIGNLRRAVQQASEFIIR